MKQEEGLKLGSVGSCFCPKCHTKIDHEKGQRCQQTACPECGAKMLRVGSFHYSLFMKKLAEKAR